MNYQELIYNVFDGLTGNHFGVLGLPDEPMWEKPLIGVAAGDDPYYAFLKEHIGEFHWSPAEAFALKYGDKPDASKLRVISMVFPQTKATRDMQAKADIFPCDRWVVSRGEWEGLMREFSPQLEQEFEARGMRAASIDCIKEFSRHDSPTLGVASNWSHRHTAYAAGLGTFGLSDGFISEKGKAIRLTSIIVEGDIEVTPRGDRGPYDWCTRCGACVHRCPINAISLETGHDKWACFDYEDYAIEHYWPAHIEKGDYIFGCGLCQVKVPCSSKRPVQINNK